MKENIKSGNNIELEGVTILNDISVAEKKETEVKIENNSLKENEEVSQNNIPESQNESSSLDATVIPEGSVEVNFTSGEIPTSIDPIPVKPIVPEIPSLESSIPIENSSNTFYEQQKGEEYSFNTKSNYEYSYNNINNNYDTSYGNSVFKTPDDVDKAMEKVVGEIKDSYEKYLSGPTKVLAAFVDEFMRWGQEVTSKGLNRELLEEYDRLVDKVKNTSSIGNSSNMFKDNAIYNNYNDNNNIKFGM